VAEIPKAVCRPNWDCQTPLAGSGWSQKIQCSVLMAQSGAWSRANCTHVTTLEVFPLKLRGRSLSRDADMYGGGQMSSIYMGWLLSMEGVSHML